MAFFHLRTIPGQRWPGLPDSKFARVWNTYLELDRTQWLPRAEIERGQLRQVRALLRQCVAHVPYYRDVLRQSGIAPDGIRTMADFRQIPRLPRRVYQEHIASAPASVLPPGTVATATKYTSGSSGTPTPTHMTNLSNLWWFGFFLRDLEWCQLDPTGSLAIIRSTLAKGEELQRVMQGITLPCWAAPLDGLIQSGPSHIMEILQDPRVQLQWLRQIQPNYLLSYPATLETLAVLVRHEGPIRSLRAIQSISDSLTPEMQRAIESAFEVPVKNTYSCNEAGYLASPCPAGQGLHVHAENVLLEVLDAYGNPSAPGQIGRVYVTHLHNLRGPFLRYELGDEAALGPEQCPCGRGLPLLTQVHGKCYPIFRLPGGGTKHSVLLAVAMRKLGGHWQHQVVQRSLEEVLVRVAPDPSWTEEHAESVRHIVHEFFETPLRVVVELMDRIPMPSNGKYQSMTSELR